MGLWYLQCLLVMHLVDHEGAGDDNCIEVEVGALISVRQGHGISQSRYLQYQCRHSAQQYDSEVWFVIDSGLVTNHPPKLPLSPACHHQSVPSSHLPLCFPSASFYRPWTFPILCFVPFSATFGSYLLTSNHVCVLPSLWFSAGPLAVSQEDGFIIIIITMLIPEPYLPK